MSQAKLDAVGGTAAYPWGCGASDPNRKTWHSQFGLPFFPEPSCVGADDASQVLDVFHFRKKNKIKNLPGWEDTMTQVWKILMHSFTALF